MYLLRSALAAAGVLLASSCALAQQGSLELRARDPSLPPGLGSGTAGGLPPELPAGVGSAGRQGRSLAEPPRRGVYADPAGCAPGQVDLNHTGCQPAEWLGRDTLTSYDRGIETMSPLRGLTLDLDPGPPTGQ